MQHAFDASLRSNRAVSIVGIDNSHAALAELRTRFPQACSVLADAKSIPFRDGSFDVAFSQFGLEYAGAYGFDDAARVIARAVERWQQSCICATARPIASALPTQMQLAACCAPASSPPPRRPFVPDSRSRAGVVTDRSSKRRTPGSQQRPRTSKRSCAVMAARLPVAPCGGCNPISLACITASPRTIRTKWRVGSIGHRGR